MQEYQATPLGELIAVESGLKTLASRLYREHYTNLLFEQLTEAYPYYPLDNDPEEIESGAVEDGRRRLTHIDEKLTFGHGLSIDPARDSWRYQSGLAKDTLFPLSNVNRFMNASIEDRYVVSGVAGLQLVNFKSKCELLARSKCGEYGFRNFSESCAFVGAYVVGKFYNANQVEGHGNWPSFNYSSGGISHKVSVGAYIHGDFYLSEERVMEGGIISPINTPTEYGPVDRMGVAGYHNVEPCIVESMITYKYLMEGKQSAAQLVDEMIDVLEQLMDSEGKISFKRENFGDYGDGDIDVFLGRVRSLIDDEACGEKLSKTEVLHISSYSPESPDAMFEIVALDNGIKFQNRLIGNDSSVRGIEIGSRHFSDLFGVILSQTQAGLSRTSPHQLVQLIGYMKHILA